MTSLFCSHHNFWTRERKVSLYEGLLLLSVSLIVQVFASRYSARSASGAAFVGDLFLDHLPTVRLDPLIVQGAVLLTLVGSFLVARRPHVIPFAAKAVALFIVIRAFFINLTHLGVHPQQLFSDDHGIGSGVYNSLTYEGNFFFSGHVGVPFLMALIFWQEPFLRRMFLCVSGLFAVAVLLAHVHYSIDVFSSPFITYGIFGVARALFVKDYRLLESSEKKDTDF